MDQWASGEQDQLITGTDVIGIVLLLGGLWMVVDQGYYLLYGLRSRHWPSTDGRVLEAQAGALPDQIPGAARWYPGGLRMAYEYTVAGKRYIASRSSFQGHWPGMGTAVRLALQYQQRREVRVWYDPANPRRAVLRPGASTWNVVATAFGFAVAVAGWTLLR